MAEQEQQQQDHRPGLQHLAHLQQDSAPYPAQVLHQHQVGAQPQYQAAVIAVQDLERQRLQKLSQDLAENPPL